MSFNIRVMVTSQQVSEALRLMKGYRSSGEEEHRVDRDLENLDRMLSNGLIANTDETIDFSENSHSLQQLRIEYAMVKMWPTRDGQVIFDAWPGNGW